MQATTTNALGANMSDRALIVLCFVVTLLCGCAAAGPERTEGGVGTALNQTSAAADHRQTVDHGSMNFSFAIAAHEVSHALRHHRGVLLARLRTVLNKRCAVAGLGLCMVSILAKAIEAKVLNGPALADLLGSTAVLATGTIFYGAAISVILLDEWRTSFPEAMRLMSTSGLFSASYAGNWVTGWSGGVL